MDINKMDEAIEVYKEIKKIRDILRKFNIGNEICITDYTKSTNYSHEYHEILMRLNDDAGAIKMLEEYYKGKLYVLENKFKEL